MYLQLQAPVAAGEMSALMDTPVALCFANGTRLPVLSWWDIEQGTAGVPSTRFQADGSLIIRLLQAVDLSQVTAVEVNGTAFALA